MIVIDQPFRRRRDRASFVDRLGIHAVGIQQYRRVVRESACQRVPLDRFRRHTLRKCKAPRMLLETLQAEELFADRCGAVPRRRRRAPENAADEGYQNGLSAAHSCAMSPMYIAGRDSRLRPTWALSRPS